MLKTFLSLLLVASLAEADKAVKQKNYPKAIQAYQQYLKNVDANSYQALYGLARVLAFSKDYDGALKIYSQLIQKFPKDVDSRIGRGRVYAWMQKFAEAEQDLLKATQMKSDYLDAWSALGDTYRWSRQYDKVVRVFSKMIDLSPRQARFYLARAQAYIQLKAQDKARRDLAQAKSLGANTSRIEKLLASKPTPVATPTTKPSAKLVSPDILEQAEKAFKAQNYKKASQYYQNYLDSVDPNSHGAQFALARSLAFGKEYLKALKIYTRLLKTNPKDVDSRIGRARVFAWLQKYQEAERDLLKARKQQPDYEEVWESLADLYRWSQQSQLATRLYKEWIKAQPKSSAPYLSRAKFNFSFRKFAQAREDIEMARKLGAPAHQLNPLLANINRPTTTLDWEISSLYEFQAFLDPRPFWHTGTLGIKRQFPFGSLELQALGTTRFDKWDQALVLDGYTDLWTGAYTNIRLLGTIDPEVIASYDAMGELYQNFPGGWEVSALYRLMAFNAGNVHFFGASLGKYLGSWYFRVDPRLFIADEGPGAQVSLWGRYYYDTADDFVELRTGFGRRVAVVGSGPRVEGQNNAFALLSVQKFFTPNFGIFLAGNFNYDQLFPTRYGGTAGIRVRL